MDGSLDTSPTVSAYAIGPRPEDGIARTSVALADGRSLAYAETGSGPPVVLIHGTLTLLEDMWLALAPRLSALGHRVIALDRPGHGSSERSRLLDASPWRQAALIREALARLGVARPIVVGHSYGGAVALGHALAYPDDTAGVVALAPLCFPEVRLEQALFGTRSVPVLGDVLARVLGAGLDPIVLPLLWRAIFLPQAMPTAFAAGFPFGHAAGPRHMSVEGEDALAVWPALTRAAMAYPSRRVPVHVLGGTADLVINNALHGLPAAAMMPGARYDWLPGLGHMLHHFAGDEIAAAVCVLHRKRVRRCI